MLAPLSNFWIPEPLSQERGKEESVLTLPE